MRIRFTTRRWKWLKYKCGWYFTMLSFRIDHNKKEETLMGLTVYSEWAWEIEVVILNFGIEIDLFEYKNPQEE